MSSDCRLELRSMFVSVLIADWSAAGEGPSVRSNSGKVQRNTQQPGSDKYGCCEHSQREPNKFEDQRD
jgi:hypothetical protein